MNDGNAIEVKNVTKAFRLYHEKRTTLFEHLVGLLDMKKTYEKLVVLDGVTFDLPKGEVLGIIGKNGEGKTTLLRLLGRIFSPDSGTIETQGKIVPFIAIGSGFQPELTARENIILYGSLLGFSKKHMVGLTPKILEFAELPKFADTRLKNFSTGMHARLAFSIAVQTDPDIMLIDEVLSVGDINFQKKSFQTIQSFRNEGKTIVLVTHNLDTVRSFCDRALLLEKGRIHAFGKPSDVIESYLQITRKKAVEADQSSINMG